MLHTFKQQAVERNNQGGEECSSRCNVALSEAVAVVEGETCTTGSNLSKEGRVSVEDIDLQC